MKTEHEIIIEYIKKHLLDKNDTTEISSVTPLITDAHIDSLGLMSLINFLETEFKISIPDGMTSIKNFNTVESIVTCINELKTNGSEIDPFDGL